MEVVQIENKEKRNNSIYKLVSSGQHPRDVGDLYGLTENCIRLIYRREVVKQDKLYRYFKSVPMNDKEARRLTKRMNKLGVDTVKDFQSRSLKSLLKAVSGAKPDIMEALIKARSPESYKLYEFIKQNRDKCFFKKRFYFILIDAGVETMDDFCVFRLNTLYCAKGTGDLIVTTLKGLQEHAKTLTR